jgi:hypothetical protein
MSSVGATLPATNVYMDGGTHATLQGSLTDLRSFASAMVWFDWGYNTGYGNVVGTQITNVIGSFNYALAHFDPSQIVHYRFVVDNGDAVAYGSDQTFTIVGGAGAGTTAQPSGASASYNLINSVVLLALLGVTIYGMIKLSSEISGIGLLVILAAVIYITVANLQGIQALLHNLW